MTLLIVQLLHVAEYVDGSNNVYRDIRRRDKRSSYLKAMRKGTTKNFDQVVRHIWGKFANGFIVNELMNCKKKN